MAYDSSELFASTAPYYAQFRPGWPRGLFEQLAVRFDLDGSQNVLDLGCGTGQIALPLAPHVRQVLAVDPEPTMLQEGRRLASERDIQNIEWCQGTSDQLRSLARDRSFRLVTMGASFHWMDRDAVLVDLSTLVGDGGAVVVVTDGPPERRVEAAWGSAVAEIREKHLGPTRRAGAATFVHSAEGHVDVLRRSAFARVDTLGWEWTQQRTIEQIIELQFSYSFSSPLQLGDRMASFADDLRSALQAHATNGTITTRHYTEANIATR